MKQSRRIAVGAAASAVALGLGLAVAAYAHPGAGFGPQGAGPAGFGPGAMRGMGPGMGPPMMRAGFGGPMVQQLMTPEERQAFIDKMRNAKTFEERQKLAEANRAEIEKRAKDKGITLPQPPGARAGFGPPFAPPAVAPTR